MMAAATEAVTIATSDEGRRRRESLWKNVAWMKERLAQIGFQVQSSTSILPIIIGDERRAVELSQALLEKGIFVSAIRFPTVAKGKARLRVTVTASHQADDIDRFIEQLSRFRAT
jgi:7-keto-8-aminopelargonate synthetase-like enzyme